MDVNSRLLKDRIIMLGKGVDDAMANNIVSQLLYLANEDLTADITLYINSPGGSISSGMAIFDTMQFIPCDVSTGQPLFIFIIFRFLFFICSILFLL